MHVLIIEDEPLVAMSIECFLEELGADTIDIAETEDEALAAASHHRPDLMTADFSLREGTGPAAVTRIREQLGDVPTIFITGQPERCATEMEGAEILAKPVLWLQLAQAVGRYNLPPN